MSDLSTVIVAVSLMAAVGLAIWWFVRTRNAALLALHLATVVVVLVLLRVTFGFPGSAALTKGPSDRLPVVGLFVAMVLGIVELKWAQEVARA